MSLYCKFPFNISEFEKKVHNRLYPENVSLESLIIDHSIDKEKASNWISKFEKKDAAKQLLNSIKHISWKEFKYELIHLAVNMTKLIKGEYGFPSTKKGYKSNSFFTSIVYKEVFSSWKNPSYSDAFDNPDYDYNNIVIVDDATYSGSQLMNSIESIYQILITDKLTYKNNEKIFYISTKSMQDINMISNIRFSPLKNKEYTIAYLSLKNIKVFYLIKKTNDKIEKIEYKVENFEDIPLKIIYDISDISDTYTFVIPEKFNKSIVNMKIPDIDIRDKIINVFICIPYISKISYNKLTKFKESYPNFNLVFNNYYNVSFDNLNTDAFALLEDYTAYGGIEFSYKDLFPIYFDHKLASPISTLSVIIGCGIVVEKNVVKNVVGTLLKNCNNADEYLEDISTFTKLYDRDEEGENKIIYDPEIHEHICIGCPITVYKLQPLEIVVFYKKLKSLGLI
jgi:hypothetical protein